MKNIIIAFALLSTPAPAIAATVLTPPITSEPCTPIQTPNGTMCAPKMSQRHDVAPNMVKLGDTIRTQYETDAKRLCHSWGGTHLIAVPNQDRAWDCFKKVK